jgi:GNAT superfamily N-acetyltransferase
MPTVIREESFIEALPEIVELGAQHWAETGLYRQFPGRMRPSPYVEKYKYAEAAGILFTLIARLDGRLVGYYVAVVQPALHYSDTLHAMTDVPYVAPEVRHRGIGVRLFVEAEKRLKARGVKLWQAGSKIDSDLHQSMDRLLRHMQFEPSDLIYSKWLGD